MRTLPLPGTPYDTNFFNRTCVFLMDDPWTVIAWSLDEGEIWREAITWSGVSVGSRTTPHLSVTDAGVVWVSRDEQLVRVDSGQVVEAGALISRFICLADGFLVAVHEDGSSIKDVVSVARIDENGRVMWRTMLEVPPELTSSMRGDRRTTWDMRLVRGDPIVAGARLTVVGACDYSGGLGCRYGLALDSGEVAWRTEARPWSYVTPTGHSWLLGQQGYGVFEIREVAEDGSELERWPSDGHVAILPAGAIHVIELENVLPSRTHATALLPGGDVRRGAHLPEFYTSRPALTADGELVFWRNGELQVVDPELRQRTLAPAPSGEEVDFPSRMHLTTEGTLAFTLGGRLWVEESDFRPVP
jgi:hypothetical protein